MTQFFAKFGEDDVFTGISLPAQQQLTEDRAGLNTSFIFVLIKFTALTWSVQAGTWGDADAEPVRVLRPHIPAPITGIGI